MKKGRLPGKNDVLLLMFFVGVAAVLFATRRCSESAFGASVRITRDGRELGIWPLSGDATFTVTAEGVVSTKEETLPENSNVVVIEGGSCSVRSADCPDGICVKRGAISRTGETIVCLPHRLVIEVVGGEAAEDAVDTIAR